MDLTFSDDQLTFADIAHEFLERECQRGEKREPAEANSSRWRALVELGWLDDELQLADHALIFEQCARVLLPGPFFSTRALAWELLSEELRADVTGGRASATMAWIEVGQTGRIAGQAFHTEPEPGGRLVGGKILVPNIAEVSHVLVTSAVGVHVVETAAQGVRIRDREGIDPTRPCGELLLDSVPAVLVAPLDALRTVETRVCIAAAFEALGVGSRSLEFAVDYVGTREQFGRKIGSYQAVAHPLADSWGRLELARSLAYWAVAAFDAGHDDAHLAALAASTAAADAAVFAVERSMQSMGGIGFTWDHPLHRYYRRSQWLAAFCGGRDRRSSIGAIVCAATPEA